MWDGDNANTARAGAAPMEERDPAPQGRLWRPGRSLLPPAGAFGAFALLLPLHKCFSPFRPSLKACLEYPAA